MTNTKNNELFINGPEGQLQLIHTIVNHDSGQVSKSAPDLAATVIICHPHPLYGGSMSNKVVHIINKAFNTLELNTIRFNFRGVEKSQGEFANGIGEVDDLLTVIDWITQQSETKNIYLAGFSFGSFIAAQVASKSQLPVTIKKLLLVAPPVSMYDFEQININIPCLVIQGGKDTVVDPEQVKQWVDGQGNNVQLEWNDDAEHFFHGKLNFIRDAILKSWF